MTNHHKISSGFLQLLEWQNFFLKKNSLNHGRYILQYGTKKADDPTRRTKCIFTALQGDAHLYSWLPKPQDFGRAHIFRAHTLYTGREKRGEKKVKAWVRELNEELIYRECRNPPQQSREKQGRIAAPWRAQAATSPRTDTAATREWGEQGAAPQGQLRSWTGASHQGQDGHIRQTLCMTETRNRQHSPEAAPI